MLDNGKIPWVRIGLGIFLESKKQKEIIIKKIRREGEMKKVFFGSWNSFAILLGFSSDFACPATLERARLELHRGYGLAQDLDRLPAPDRSMSCELCR